MARGVQHQDDTRTQVMAALLAGQGVNEVAAQYHLPKSTVSRMKKALSEDQLEQVGTQKAERIETLLFDYLSHNLTALKAQAEVAADKTYLKQFPPQQLAVLHGVMADKAVRLLEATARAEPEGKEDGAGEEG